MLFVSGKSQHTKLTFKVYDFFRELYDVKSDVEVFHTNLTNDNAFGFTEENGDEQFIQIHNNLSEKDFITTLLHELVHVMQNENGITDDKIREERHICLRTFFTISTYNLSDLKLLWPPDRTSSVSNQPNHDLLCSTIQSRVSD